MELIFFPLERDHMVKFGKNFAGSGLWALCLSCTGEEVTTEERQHPTAIFL